MSSNPKTQVDAKAAAKAAYDAYVQRYVKACLAEDECLDPESFIGANFAKLLTAPQQKYLEQLLANERAHVRYLIAERYIMNNQDSGDEELPEYDDIADEEEVEEEEEEEEVEESGEVELTNCGDAPMFEWNKDTETYEEAMERYETERSDFRQDYVAKHAKGGVLARLWNLSTDQIEELDKQQRSRKKKKKKKQSK
jgi:hypothetical protein